jgi:hypothetical protein
LNVIVTGADLEFVESTIYDSTANNNGILEPGETADLTITLTNIGIDTVYDVTGTLVCTSPYITINDTLSNTWGTFAPDDTIEGGCWNLSASPSTPPGTLIDFQLLANGLGGFSDTLPFSIEIGTPGVEENNLVKKSSAITSVRVISHGRTFSVAYNFENATEVKLCVYDALGQMITDANYGKLKGAGELQLNLEAFAQGVYFVQIEYGEKTKTSKIIWLK